MQAKDRGTDVGEVAHDGAQERGLGEKETARAVYHVNKEKGFVASHGEDLSGREILRRAGFTADKYELFTVDHGKTGREVLPDELHHVQPGDHYRATIRGTDYSCNAAKSPHPVGVAS